MTNEELLAKIKAEIERQAKSIDTATGDFAEGRRMEQRIILSVLSTLESENPVPSDLEEAADNHIRKVADAAGHPGWDWTTQDIAEAFIAGAKWMSIHENDIKEL